MQDFQRPIYKRFAEKNIFYIWIVGHMILQFFKYPPP
jgi:hypothetical protein